MHLTLVYTPRPRESLASEDWYQPKTDVCVRLLFSPVEAAINACFSRFD